MDAATLRAATRKYGLVGESILYQDLPWIGLTGGRRGSGSSARLDAILRYMLENKIPQRTSLDIGCNVGFFSLSLVERGCIAYGVEMERNALRVAELIARNHIKGSGVFVPILMECNPDTVEKLPQVETTICLSIWHHWVRHQGLDAATMILKSIWERTQYTLFFDSGESEMPPQYNLPFRDGDAVEWLNEYFHDSLAPTKITNLGRFPAFAPGQDERAGSVNRTMFAIQK